MTTSTVINEGCIQTIALAISEAPPMKVEYVYYEVTELSLTYHGDKLTELKILGVAGDTGQAEWLSTDLDRYDMVQPWIRREVEKHRPSRRLSAYRAEALHGVADLVGERIPEGAPADEWEDLIEVIEAIREKAREAERDADPGWQPKDFLKSFFDIVEP